MRTIESQLVLVNLVGRRSLRKLLPRQHNLCHALGLLATGEEQPPQVDRSYIRETEKQNHPPSGDGHYIGNCVGCLLST